MTTVDIQMSGDDNSSYEMPSELLEKLQNSDVTNIADNTIEMVEQMFSDMSPMIIASINSGLDSGINGINSGITGMEQGMAAMSGDGQAPGMSAGMGAALQELKDISLKLSAVKEALPDAFKQAGENYADSVRNMSADIEHMYQSTVNDGYRNMYLFLVAVNVVGLLMLLFYREPKRNK